MEATERAKLVAQKVHANQSYDIYPYMYHIQEVVDIAKELQFNDDIICACYLHDAIEDGDLSYKDIKKAFGVIVAEIVYAVTDELGRNRKERKEKTYPKIQAMWMAVAVKLCDRIANVRQSKEYNKELFKMYQKEHAEFKKKLYMEQGDSIALAWEMLDITLYINTSQKED